MTKASTAEGGDIRHSFNWVVSRRGILKVSTNALECGDWRIPYDTIEEAVLFSVRQMFIPGYVLCVKAGGTIYQFGLNTGQFWRGELPFPVRREAARLRYSWFSILVRLVAVGAVAYLLIRRFL
jgi:hypothetical protein